MGCNIIAVANQKGGVGKTTTAINLSQALASNGEKVLLVDLDPQGNASQGFGVNLDEVQETIGDLIRNRELPCERVIYSGHELDLIPATPLLARVEREMVGETNSELRLGRRLDALRERYSFIIIDTPPTFGPLMNSALNAADGLIIPVDAGCFAMMGIRELLAEVEEIKEGTNPRLKVLGYLLTLFDQTRIAAETMDEMISKFGDQVFESRIRRTVKLKEAPVYGHSIFHHAPNCSGAADYGSLADEVLVRTGLRVAEDISDQAAVAVAGGVQ